MMRMCMNVARPLARGQGLRLYTVQCNRSFASNANDDKKQHSTPKDSKSGQKGSPEQTSVPSYGSNTDHKQNVGTHKDKAHDEADKGRFEGEMGGVASSAEKRQAAKHQEKAAKEDVEQEQAHKAKGSDSKSSGSKSSANSDNKSSASHDSKSSGNSDNKSSASKKTGEKGEKDAKR